jgi:hypothetical protein
MSHLKNDDEVVATYKEEEDEEENAKISGMPSFSVEPPTPLELGAALHFEHGIYQRSVSPQSLHGE